VIESQTKVIVALDCDEPAAARGLVGQLPVGGCRLKVGKELFLAGGPDLVREWVDEGHEVFLDLKFHDIPNTVAAACRQAAALGVWMVNVHALGGSAMLAAAREAIDSQRTPPLLTAVTVLTSHDQASLDEIGLAGPTEAAVQRLAGLAYTAGLDGVVCSPLEAAMIRERFGDDFRRVTPGVRPAMARHQDQRRVMTPERARESGATDLVIGRPITGASDPATALAEIQRAMANA
jgi:orotidine-5'-phosphate decarboxylase